DPAWIRLPGSGAGGAWTAQDRDLADRLYRLLRQPTPREADRQRLGQSLTKLRLEPLRPHLEARDSLPGGRQVLGVPTGSGRLGPVEVLTTEYRTSYIPSGSVYARLRKQHRAVAGSSLLALGDPAFNSPPARRPEPPAQGVLVRSVQPGSNASR